jgi:hypothetical protein
MTPPRTSTGVDSRCMGASLALFKWDSGLRNAPLLTRLPVSDLFAEGFDGPAGMTRNCLRRTALSRRVRLSRTLPRSKPCCIGP